METNYEMKQKLELIKSEINGYIYKHKMDIYSNNSSYLFEILKYENLLSKYLFGKKMMKLKENELLEKIEDKNSIDIIKNSFQEYYEIYEDEKKEAIENWEKERKEFKKEIAKLEEALKELQNQLEIVERMEESDVFIDSIDYR